LLWLFAKSANLSLHEINLERHLFLGEAFRALDMEINIREFETLVRNPVNVQGPFFLLKKSKLPLTSYRHCVVFVSIIQTCQSL